MIKQKSRFFSGFVRYLADSNRRPRFCRPIPNRSGKVPKDAFFSESGCKGTAFFWIDQIFLIFLAKKCYFCSICLHICIFCSTFAAILSRDGGIGRHEGLKILWPVMAVRVQVPLAVLKEKLPNIKMLGIFCKSLLRLTTNNLVLWRRKRNTPIHWLYSL